MKKFVVTATLFAALASGCIPLIQQREINRQYAELETIQDLSLRQQKFQEIKHRESMLHAQTQQQQQETQQTLGALLLFNAFMPQPAVPAPQPLNVNVWGWSR